MLSEVQYLPQIDLKFWESVSSGVKSSKWGIRGKFRLKLIWRTILSRKELTSN